MRRTAVYVTMLLLGGGLLGALAQERSAPWPPAPVPPPKEPAPTAVVSSALPNPVSPPASPAGAPVTIKPAAPISQPKASPNPGQTLIPVTVSAPNVAEPKAGPRQSPPPPGGPKIPRLFPEKTIGAKPLLQAPAEDPKPLTAPNRGPTPGVTPVQQLGPLPLPLPSGPEVDPPVSRPVPAAETDSVSRRPPAFRLVGDAQSASVKAPSQEPSYRTQYVQPVQEAGVSALTVTKTGPATAVLGQPLPFVITITNLGQLPVNHLQVVDELPRGCRFLKASSPPRVLGDKLTWVLEPLQPGEKREIHLEVLPAVAGEWSGQVNALLAISSPFRTLITEAPLAIKIIGPERLSVGQVARFELQARNNGREPVGHLILTVHLPAGLNHALGSTIEAVIGELAPGSSKTFPLPLTVTAAGSQQLTCLLQAGAEQVASCQAILEATASPLEIHGRGPSQLLLDRVADVQIQVTNPTSKAAKNVVVTATLPEGLEYLQASDRGLYRGPTRSVHWMFEQLPAGGSHSLTLRLEAKTPGQHALQLAARGEEGKETHGSIPLPVEGVTNLVVKIMGRDGTLEVGKETVYEIRVHNQGSASATQVQLQFVMTEGLQPTTAKGPVNVRMASKTVTFAALPRLEPQTQAIFQVAARALVPGDNRCRAQVTCEQSRLPILREERTWVYQD